MSSLDVENVKLIREKFKEIGDLIEHLKKKEIRVDLEICHDYGSESVRLKDINGEFEVRAFQVKELLPED